MAARASLIALIDASVPDEVIRTISADGTRVDHLGGQVDLGLGRRAEARAGRGRRGHGGDHVRMRVAGDQRPPGHDPVDVAVAVHVDQLGALAAGDEDRVAADRAHRPDGRVHAAGQELARARS